MAEWLGKGLQNPVRRFNSARDLGFDNLIDNGVFKNCYYPLKMFLKFETIKKIILIFLQFIKLLRPSRQTTKRPGGEIGIHEGLKILWTYPPCGFESRPGHQN